MAHDIQQDRIRPEPERRLSKAPHPWMFVLQDTMLYGYEAVYDGRKPTAKGALKFHTERKARRGDNEPRIGSKEIKQAYSSCFGEGGLFHRYRPDLYEDILALPYTVLESEIDCPDRCGTTLQTSAPY